MTFQPKYDYLILTYANVHVTRVIHFTSYNKTRENISESKLIYNINYQEKGIFESFVNWPYVPKSTNTSPCLMNIIDNCTS